MDGKEKSQQPAVASPSPRRGWRRRVGRAIVLFVFVPYLAVTLIFVIFQRTFMYQPTVAEDLRVAVVALDPKVVDDIRIQTPDGQTLNGWLLKTSKRDQNQKTPLVIYFPGNSLNRKKRIPDLREVTACGFDVMIFDYRGYGDSSGSPSEGKLTSDARLIWEYACNHASYDESQIVIFGESLGGAVALSLWSTENSQHPKPAALILNSTFASMPRTVASHYPMFPFQFLVFDRWPSIDRIGTVDVPIIVFHGTADKMVPVAHGRELAKASTHARFIEIAGAEHNDVPLSRLRDELKQIRDSMNKKATRR